MFMADGPDWGIWKANTQIKPLITPKQAVQRVEHATKHGHVVTINLQMYEDGSVSPQSLQALQLYVTLSAKIAEIRLLCFNIG